MQMLESGIWVWESGIPLEPRPRRSVLSGFRREPQDDVHPRGQLADPRARDRQEVGGDRLARLAIANPAIDAVSFVAGMAFDVELGRQQLLAVLPDLHVDVGRAPGVWHGLDGPEVVLAGR